MRKSPNWILFLTVAALICATMVAQEAKIPKLLKRVTDFTGTLSASEIEILERDLAVFEDSTSNQLVVVIVSTVGEEAIEEYALRIAEANRIGQKGRDNGIILLIAKADRKIRIQVGYGLEGVLPDGLAGTIIRREITPAFRANDFYGGVKAGVDAIMLATRNEYKGAKKKPTTDFPLIMVMIILGIVFFTIARSARRNAGLMSAAGLPIFYGGGRPRGGGGSGGGGFGGFSGGGGSFGGGGASGGW
jgi:uncharacterized protein